MIDAVRRVVSQQVETSFLPVVLRPPHVDFSKEGLITWGYYNVVIGEPYRISGYHSADTVLGGYVIIDLFSDIQKRSESPSVAVSRASMYLSNTRAVDNTDGITKVEFGIPTYEMKGRDVADRNLERIVVNIAFKAYFTRQ